MYQTRIMLGEGAGGNRELGSFAVFAAKEMQVNRCIPSVAC